MSHSFAGCASTARSTFPTSARRTISQRWVPAATFAHLLDRSPSPAGRTHWSAERASHRGAPLHPGADQAARNLRRPGGDRHRERAAVPTSSRSRWNSKRRRVKSWASSPARRRIFSRCWTWSRRMPRDYAMLSMHRSGASMATEFDSLPSTGRSRVRGSKKADRSSEDWRVAERSSIARPSTFRILSRQTFRLNFRKPGR